MLVAEAPLSQNGPTTARSQEGVMLASPRVWRELAIPEREAAAASLLTSVLRTRAAQIRVVQINTELFEGWPQKCFPRHHGRSSELPSSKAGGSCYRAHTGSV